MITLKDISSYKILDYISCYSTDFSNIYLLLNNYNITNCLELKLLIESGVLNDKVSSYVIFMLKNEISSVEAKLSVINSSGKEIFRYYFDIYEKLGLFDELSYTDKYVLEDNLIFERFKNNCDMFSSISNFSIYQLKDLMTRVDSKKFRLGIYDYLVFKPKEKANLIYNRICFYEMQVIRQYLLLSNRNCSNYFTYDFFQKRELLRSKLKDLLDYLESLNTEFLWGTLSKRQLSLISSDSIKNRFYQDSFLEMIANYATIEEIENGLLVEQDITVVDNNQLVKKRLKPVDRFVK